MLKPKKQNPVNPVILSKGSLCLLWLSFFLALPGLAGGEITFTAVNNNDGTLTIGYSSFTGEPPVGIALKITDCGDSIPAVYNGDIYYDVIRELDPNAGQIVSFDLLSVLGSQGNFPSAVTALATIDFGKVASGNLTVNAAQGGIVGREGSPINSNLPLPFYVTDGQACWLCDGQDQGNTNGDDAINLADLLVLKASFGTSAAGNVHGTGTGEYNCCADFNRDGMVNLNDLLQLKAHFGTSGFATCPAISCP